MLEAPSQIMRPTLGGRLFTYAAPFLWNNLPDNFVFSMCYCVFNLIIYLFIKS